MGTPPSLLIDFHFDPLHHNYLALYLITAIALLYVVVERNWHRAGWRRWRWVVVADMALLAGYMVDKADGETLAVLHTFGGKLPDQVTVPVRASRILRTMCSENNQITLRDGQLKVEIRAPFEAVAVHLAEH